MSYVCLVMVGIKLTGTCNCSFIRLNRAEPELVASLVDSDHNKAEVPRLPSHIQKPITLPRHGTSPKLRRLVLDRDNHECQLCGKAQTGCSLHVHHVDGNQNRNIVLNLIALCAGCHKRTHQKDSLWQRDLEAGYITRLLRGRR